MFLVRDVMTNATPDRPNFDRRSHWEHVYSAKQPDNVSWYQRHPEYSLDLIKGTAAGVSAEIIDVGGGASTLVDHLLDAGYRNITVLDIAHGAIERARERLGARAGRVVWLQRDITEFSPDKPYDIWHDRAVFHFLTDRLDRSRYVRVMARAINPGAHAIIATFGPKGPGRCSGLQVVRYSPDTLSAVLGDSFRLVESRTEQHTTPGGSSQDFIYCRFKRVAP